MFFYTKVEIIFGRQNPNNFNVVQTAKPQTNKNDSQINLIHLDVAFNGPVSFENAFEYVRS
jgi:hypothetical protein